MGSKSDYLELKVLDHILGGGDYARPATVYIALFNVSPSDAGGGTEVSGPSYARKSVTNNATNFPAAAAGSKSNGTQISFAQATGSWGTVVAFAIFDASTAGNMLYWGAISPSKTFDNGDTAVFEVGDLVITED